jgi:hypothetical protein
LLCEQDIGRQKDDNCPDSEIAAEADHVVDSPTYPVVACSLGSESSVRREASTSQTSFGHPIESFGVVVYLLDNLSGRRPERSPLTGTIGEVRGGHSPIPNRPEKLC